VHEHSITLDEAHANLYTPVRRCPADVIVGVGRIERGREGAPSRASSKLYAMPGEREVVAW
jgi:hypothetical protein